jgi:hypothetical protein
MTRLTPLTIKKKCVTNIFAQTAFPGLLWLKICDNNNNKIMLKEVSQQ